MIDDISRDTKDEDPWHFNTNGRWMYEFLFELILVAIDCTKYHDC